MFVRRHEIEMNFNISSLPPSEGLVCFSYAFLGTP